MDVLSRVGESNKIMENELMRPTHGDTYVKRFLQLIIRNKWFIVIPRCCQFITEMPENKIKYFC